MSRSYDLSLLKLTAAVVMTPLLMLGNSGGPPTGNAGAPEGGTLGCARAGCHTGTGNPFSSGIEINFGAQGANYVPGVKQTWTMTVPSASVYGFQMTARLVSDERNAQAGTFTPGANMEVLCQTGSTRPAAGCAAATPIEFLQHSNSLRSNSIQIEWTPPATDRGDVKIFVAVNSANGNGNNSGDRITIQNFTLKPQAGGGGGATPAIRADQPVLQSFSGRAGISPGTWAEIYGTNLSTATRAWAGSDFNGGKAPTTVEGVRVKIAGKDAFVGYVSPTQVNVQVPDDIGTGDGITVEVTNAAGTATSRTTAAAQSPALLTTPNFLVGGRQYVAALFTDFVTFVGREGLIAGVPFRPAKPGDTIVIYAVGCGATNPASPAGEVVAAARPLATPVVVRFGQTTATAQAFLAPQAVGLCQFNVTVPNVPAGDIAIDATVNGVANGQNLFTTIGQ